MFVVLPACAAGSAGWSLDGGCHASCAHADTAIAQASAINFRL